MTSELLVDVARSYIRRISTALVISTLVLSSSIIAVAQSVPTVTVTRLIHIAGVFERVAGQPPAAVEIVTVSIYADADGGRPVWQERQPVAIEKNTRRFTLLLGASDPAGIPADVTHEYRINNIASSGSINFMLGSASKFRVDSVGTTISGPVDIFAGAATFAGLKVYNTGPTARAIFGSTATDTAIGGIASDVAAGWAGFFDGDVRVSCTLYKGEAHSGSTVRWIQKTSTFPIPSWNRRT